MLNRQSIILLIFILNTLFNAGQIHSAPSTDSESSNHLVPLSPISRNWINRAIIAATPRTSARTAVLIISPARFGNSFTEKRWALGKHTWEQYMNSHPNVDCYFIRTVIPDRERSDTDQVWIEGNTIFVGDVYQEKYACDRILFKTIAALKYLLPHYSHFVRTNINTFFNLWVVNEYMETHATSLYTTPSWENNWYATGYALLFTQDVADHMINEFQRIQQEAPDLVSHHQADDCVITALATGIWPSTPDHPFQVCPSLPDRTIQLMSKDSFKSSRITEYGVFLLPPISLDIALQYCDHAGNTPMMYRNREGLTLEELTQLYDYLIYKIYPELERSL